MKVSEGIHVTQQLVLNNNSERKRAYAIQRDYVAHVVNQLNANVPKHLFKFFFLFLQCNFSLLFSGIEQFCTDIENMIGHRPNMYFRLCWKFISPLIIFVSMLHSLRFFQSNYAFQACWKPSWHECIENEWFKSPWRLGWRESGPYSGWIYICGVFVRLGFCCDRSHLLFKGVIFIISCC